MSKLEALTSDLVEQVLETWRATEQPYLLSKLGQEMTRRGHDLKQAAGGRSLAGLIRTQLSDQIRTLPDPEDEKIVWAIPADVDPASVAFPRRVPKSDRTPRMPLDRRVLSAFTTPIQDGMVRTFTLEPEIRADDVHQDVAQAIAKPALTPSDIHPVPVASPAERDRLQERVVTWARAHDIPIEKLAPRFLPESQNRASLLSALIDALEPADLARISIPLDLVAKLNKASLR